MSLKGNTAQERAWNFFMSKGVGEYGTAGIMASIRAESAFNPCNLQNSYNKKLNISDEDYTRLVDGNNYPGFVTDKAGYGLAQWTYYTRKQNLLDYAKQQGKSIGDEEMQLNFIWIELSGAYKGVLSKLKSTKSAQEASDIILTGYEKPKDQGESAKKIRGGYAEEYYNQFAVKKGTTSMKIVIGSARRDENGNYTGGKAGDQDGVEVSIQDYYLHKKGWYLYRALSEEHAQKLAQAMYDACMNNNIGYCQAHRAIMTMLKKYGSMKAIGEMTETDCSNLVRGCIYQATGIDVGSFNTASEPGTLDKSGLFAKKQSVTSTTRFQVGDILVTKTKGHTVIVISVDGETVKSTVQETNPANIKINSAKSKLDSLAGNYVTTANLHLRTGAGKDKTSITIIPVGKTVKCYGYYTDVNGTKWLLVVYNGMTGFCSSKYLLKA